MRCESSHLKAFDKDLHFNLNLKLHKYVYARVSMTFTTSFKHEKKDYLINFIKLMKKMFGLAGLGIGLV